MSQRISGGCSVEAGVLGKGQRGLSGRAWGSNVKTRLLTQKRRGDLQGQLPWTVLRALFWWGLVQVAQVPPLCHPWEPEGRTLGAAVKRLELQ